MYREGGSIASGAQWSDIALGCGDIIVGLYGVYEFLADIDRDRQFYADGPHVIGDIMSWIVDVGFHEYFRRHGVEEKTALAYRQRHLITASKRTSWV